MPVFFLCSHFSTSVDPTKAFFRVPVDLWGDISLRVSAVLERDYGFGGDYLLNSVELMDDPGFYGVTATCWTENPSFFLSALGYALQKNDCFAPIKRLAVPEFH